MLRAKIGAEAAFVCIAGVWAHNNARRSVNERQLGNGEVARLHLQGGELVATEGEE